MFLIFQCPATGKDIDSGIRTDQRSVSRVAQAPVTLACPHCHGAHRLRMVDGRLSDSVETVRPGQAASGETRLGLYP